MAVSARPPGRAPAAGGGWRRAGRSWPWRPFRPTPGSRERPWARPQRTGTFLAVTTFGTSGDAERAVPWGRRVREQVELAEVHGRVAAHDPNIPYVPYDPHGPFGAEPAGPGVPWMRARFSCAEGPATRPSSAPPARRRPPPHARRRKGHLWQGAARRCQPGNRPVLRSVQRRSA
ncbi:oxygenase MpaB family protein [Streptomyces roseolus]|uniref:oxygenase MpaB family protein n=1 Tax=Streptomyces roseolus TaxID=67358 RepID=UPI0036571E4D